MKSLYAWIVVSMVSASSLGLLAFTTISNHIERTYLQPVLQAMDELQLQDAREALRTGGPAAASRYLSRLDRLFGAGHYLLNAAGRDVVSGRDLRAWLMHPQAADSRGFVGARFVVAHRARDGRYWFLSIGPPQVHGGTFVPYYEVAVGAAAFLSVLAAVGIVMPLRRLARVVDRFGQGDLSVRSKWRRPDEIGQLGRAFDDMADRVERLVLGERRLLQDVSHELRSPLARLKLAIKLARTATDPPAALDRVERHLDRIASLTAEIVEMVRIEGEPQNQRWAAVDLNGLVAEVVADCRAEAEARGCRLPVAGRVPCAIVCDRELVRRALENVLRNAIRFSPERAAIDVDLAESAASVTLAVRDRGPGVPEDTLERLFEPFFRVDAARDSEGGGVGLGLSIARRAVVLHSGTIIARNARPGLVVTIELPRLPVKAQNAPCTQTGRVTCTK